FGVFLKGDAALVDRHAYAAYGWTIAGLLFALMLICGLGTLPMRFRLQTDHAGAAPSPARFLRELGHAFQNRSFVILFASIIIFSTKAAIALGSLIAGVSLDLIGFPRAIASLGPNPVIAADTVRDLGLLVGPGAGLMALTCILFLARYSLDGAKVARIQVELA